MIHPKIALSFVSLLPVFSLRAQQPAKPVLPASSVVAAKSTNAAVEADALLASWLAADSNGEVAQARIAVRRAQSAEVKQFAQKMVDEHTKLGGELRPFAADADSAKTAHRSGDEAERSTKSSREVVEASSNGKAEAPVPFDHLALIRDLSQRCTAEQEKSLEALANAKFDRGFMLAQVGAHTRAVIMVEVFRSRASSELRPLLDQAGKTLRSHLEQAKALCKELDTAVDAGVARKQ